MYLVRRVQLDEASGQQVSHTLPSQSGPTLFAQVVVQLSPCEQRGRVISRVEVEGGLRPAPSAPGKR